MSAKDRRFRENNLRRVMRTEILIFLDVETSAVSRCGDRWSRHSFVPRYIQFRFLPSRSSQKGQKKRRRITYRILFMDITARNSDILRQKPILRADPVYAMYPYCRVT